MVLFLIRNFWDSFTFLVDDVLSQNFWDLFRTTAAAIYRYCCQYVIHSHYEVSLKCSAVQRSSFFIPHLPVAICTTHHTWTANVTGILVLLVPNTAHCVTLRI